MLITPPTPASLASSSPQGQSATTTQRTSKRLRGLKSLSRHISNLQHAPQSPLQTPASPLLTDSTVSNPASNGLSSNGPVLVVTSPPAIQRPAENQTIGYFPDLDANPSVVGGATLPSIEEGAVATRARSPGEASVNSTESVTSESARISRSMARRRTSTTTNTTNAVLRPNAQTPQDTSSTFSSSDRESQSPPSFIVSTRTNNMASNMPDAASSLAGLPADQMPTIRFIPYQDPRSNKPSLAFSATSRTLPHEGCVIRVGRYSERDSSPGPAPNVPSAAPVGFKSKVVSRRHCEFWCSQGQWYVKDVKSSSGTFLNHIRLSQPSTESRPFPVNDGDIVQLGMDFRGGEESIFRSVKIRVECNRAWQKSLNSFNVATHRQLRALSSKQDDDVATNSTECSICLMAVAPCQSLFVAPCSHVWHFKCIRPILNNEKLYPQFLCPNCRAVADLEADVEDTIDTWQEGDEEDHSSVEDDDAAPTTSRGNRSGTLATDGPADASIESLAQIVNQVALNDGRSLQPQEATGARPIQRRREGNTSETLAEPFPVARTPSHNLRDPRVAIEMLEGVVTPTNEAGPFVFDGSQGRAAGARISAITTGSTE